jgi:CBS domain-containing protein
MNVTEIMSRDVISATPDCPLDDALALFETHPFRHLPVISDGTLVGMVSDRDIALATGWLRARDRNADGGVGPRNVGQIMTEDVQSLTEQSTAKEAAEVIRKRRIGCMPVLDDSRVAGLVSSTDLLSASVEEELNSDWKLRSDDSVSTWMTTEVHSASPEMSVYDALDLCKDRDVRHLPVVEDGIVVGMVSDRDLRFSLGQEIISDRAAQSQGRLEVLDTTLSAIMVDDVTTASADCSLREAVGMMLEFGFSALPVEENGQLVGIITHTDILRSCC